MEGGPSGHGASIGDAAWRERPGRGRIAFAVWATALGAGVLFHEWQIGPSPWSIHGAAALAAIAVLLRPASTARLVVLLGLLAVELVVDLPNPSNHLVVVGVFGAAVFTWWLALLARSPSRAREPAYVYERVAPFLRTGFIMAWYLIAFAKLNSGFVDTNTTCAAWILAQIPVLQVPDGLNGLLSAGTILMEFAIPTLLIFPRTRPLGVALGLGFHLVAAAGGHTAFSGLAWSFYPLFLSQGTLARIAATARGVFSPRTRRTIVSLARSPLTWVVLAAIWLLATNVVQALPGEWEARGRRWGAALPYGVYALAWGWLLIGSRRRLLLTDRMKGFELSFREPVLAAALVLLVVNAASPYVGLKTRYSFTMYSNLRTEPGYWNHLVLPESIRRFGWQDGRVRFVSVGDPSLAEAIESHGTGAENQLSLDAGEQSTSTTQFVLEDARLLVLPYPRSSVVYELDGVVHRAARVASDPVLGERPSFAIRTLGGFRPVSSACQH